MVPARLTRSVSGDDGATGLDLADFVFGMGVVYGESGDCEMRANGVMSGSG